MKNFKKLFASVAIVAMLASTVPTAVLGAASYSDELEGAYDYAATNGITSASSIDNANMYGSLTRVAMAKMMANYAIEVLGLTPDTSKDCSFTDVSETLDAQYDNGVTNACQLGLMGVGITEFNPNGLVNRAQFGTVLSRAMYGDENNDGDPYYVNHLNALKDAGIMNNISNPNALEVRGYVMLMMQRADEGTTPAICETPENVLSCSLGLDTCPAECESSIVKAGTLDVKLASSNGGDIPQNISSLPVVTYKLTAQDSDVELSSVTLEQGGYSDNDTLTNVALFINGQRVSRATTNNIEADDEIEVDLTDTYVIKAGSSIELTVNATVGASTSSDQFTVALTKVNTSAEDVNYASNLTSETYKVVATDNASIAVKSGSMLSDIMLGASAVDVLEFKLDNTNNTQNAEFKSITLKAGNSDVATYLENFKLKADDKTIATTTSMNGKYLTFVVEDSYVVEDGKSEIFTIAADVVDGAGETVTFAIETISDVLVIGDKYDVAMTVTKEALKSFDISAGDLTLTKVNPGSAYIIRNRTNLSLGAFTIKNNKGGNLNLESFQLDFATGTSATGIANILKNVKVRLGSTTASLKSLDMSNVDATWSIDDLSKSVGSALTVYVYADIEDKDMTSASFTMTLTGISVKEPSNDKVADVSPESMTYAQMKGAASSLKLTNSILPDKSVSKGTENIEATKFTVKTSTTEGAKLTKMTFTAVDNTVAVNSNIVSSVVLYKGTTEVAAKLYSGTVVITDDITLAANTTTTFTLKVNLQANATGDFAYDLTSIEAEDTTSDKNDISSTSITDINGRVIMVKQNASVSLTASATNDTNKYANSILAGTTKAVAHYDVYSNYEDANVGTIKVAFSKSVKAALNDVVVKYNGTKVASNPTWDTNTAVFEDLDFDMGTEEGYLTVELETKTINQDGGITITGAKVSSIDLDDVKGAQSLDAVTVDSVNSAASLFDIIPATIAASVKDASTIALNVNLGSNKTTLGNQVKTTLKGLTFSVPSTNGGLLSFRVEKEDGTAVGVYTSTGAATSFTGIELGNGENLLKIYFTQSGSINTPQYIVKLSDVTYTGNVTADTLSNRMPAALTVINK